jgi:hypothetical protein
MHIACCILALLGLTLSYDKVAAKLRMGVGTWGAGGSNMRSAREARPAEASSLCAQNLAAA